ncbi:amino acid adenylation domain-containing protein [Streptomyces sp. NPDC097619]|uniref:amino acid adenylation domain-containing protein n=1 Tax=Streptomyces sp. NPDC097619 TaxID=3157228 RepID=UPI00332740EB
MAEQRYAAAFAQQRLWLLQALEPEGTAYHLTEAFRVTGPLDTEALSRAARDLCDRHDALRTRFEQDAGEIRQIVADPGTEAARPGFHHTRRPAPAGAERDATVAGFHREVLATPFDLGTGPLVRIHVATLGGPGEEDHAVAVTAHHIVCDGWSMRLLLDELSALYAGRVAGTPADLPEPELQYPDYTVWEREWLDEERTSECLKYWRAHLAGAPTVLHLPGDRPRGATTFPASGVHRLPLPQPTVDRVRELARSARSTPATVLLAAFHAFLSRITGERDVVVGHPVGSRSQAGTEQLVGMLVNTLPLRGDLRDDPSFGELLQRIRAAVLDGREYGELPFERIVEEVNPDRTQGVNPLVQVMFQLLEEDFAGTLRLPGATTRALTAEQPTTTFDLSLDVYARGGGMTACFDYSRDLFDPETVARLAEGFAVLLAAATADPDLPVSELPLLTPAEEHRILHELGRGPVVPVPGGATVLTALADRIASMPEETAVTDATESLSYREFGAAVDAVAAGLAAHGIGRGDRVGLLTSRSARQPVGVFGVLRAGAVLVPLDPANPPERLHSIAREAGLRLLVADTAVRDRAAALGLPLLDPADPGPEVPAPPPAPPGPEDPAYVVFTSGSTATPKGVVVRHGSLANLYHSHRASHYAEMAATVPGRRLRVALTMSMAFDACWDQLLWMVDGHLLDVFDDDTSRDAVKLLDAVRARRTDVLEATPSFLEQLVGLGLLDPDEGTGAGHGGPRLFVLGGEAVRPSLWTRLAEHPAVTAVNMYGPTEFTVDALVAPVTAATGPVIGRPLANCAVAVLDPTGRPVPVGVTGEICLSGPQLAVGYLDDPDRTAERFTTDPHLAVPGGRMYRTGDLGRLRGDGLVEFAGRIDGQLKIRGYRIDPGEVESALLAHHGVRDAAVVARPDAHGHARLVGYLVPTGEPGATRGLRGHLARLLPDYMVPAALVELDAIPRNISSKIAIALLPEPEATALGVGEYTAPRPGVETALAAMFGEVLGVTAAGRHDDFFRLGGHSLSAVRLIARIRERLGAELSLTSLFEQPTPAGLAAALRAGGRGEGGIPPLAPGAPAPASTAQQRLWFLQQVAPENTGYNMVEAVRLRGPVDTRALVDSVEAVVGRHDVLRTRYHLGEDRLLVTVDPPRGGTTVPIDLSGLPADEALRQASDLVRRIAARRHDLENGPLFEAAVITLGPADHLLAFGVHHLAADGWSVKVLFTEVSAHYRDLTAGRSSTLPAPALQYQDFAAWERGADHERGLAEDLAYWREQLAGAPTELDLPRRADRAEVGAGRGDTVRFALSEEVTTALSESARQHRTTLFTALLAAFQAVLGRWSGQRDLLTGVPVAGRTRTELEGLIGLFVNILPLRADLTGDPTFEELLHRVRDTALAGYAHQAAPFERIVEAVNPTRDLGLNPLVQVTCQLFEESGAAGLDLAGVTAESVPLDVPASRFDLSLDLTRDGAALSAELVYDTDLYDRETVTALAEAFTAFTTAVAGDTGTRVHRVPLPLAPPAQEDAVPHPDPHPLPAPDPTGRAEAEAVLRAHPQIHGAVLVPAGGTTGSPRPVAHLVPADGIRADDFETFMDSWRSVFESTYVPDGADPSGDALLGWTDSFTGGTLPAAEMSAWVTGTVDRVRALAPRALLEIGAGTGLLFRPLCAGGHVERYTATDYADAAVDMLRRTEEALAAGPGAPETTVVRAEALDAAAAASGPYDTVVLNSVVQYFPSLAYLREVIDRAVTGLPAGGHVFVGDVRSAPLLEAFLCLREHSRQGDGADPDRVAAAVSRGLRTDSELSVDPGFFRELASGRGPITAVEIAPRRGTASNEMTLFRYDVVLHVGCPPESDAPESDRPAEHADPGEDLLALAERRLAASPEGFRLGRVPNARLTRALRLRDAHGFGSGEAAAPPEAVGAVHPEELWRLGARYGRTTRLGWGHGDADGSLEVSFLPAGSRSHYVLSEPYPGSSGSAPVDRPPVRVLAPQLERALTASLRADLRAAGVPEELVPDRYVFHADLRALPVASPTV